MQAVEKSVNHFSASVMPEKHNTYQEGNMGRPFHKIQHTHVYLYKQTRLQIRRTHL